MIKPVRGKAGEVHPLLYGVASTLTAMAAAGLIVGWFAFALAPVVPDRAIRS